MTGVLGNCPPRFGRSPTQLVETRRYDTLQEVSLQSDPSMSQFFWLLP